MDRRSWPWRRSPEKSPEETEESSESISSSAHSEKPPDAQTQELPKPSPNQGQSPQVTTKSGGCDDRDIERALREKLASALVNIRAKEDLVKQHSKVAEEAVSGWEKAESEVTRLKQQLESSLQKNSSLESKISQLDGALKECVRQLRLAREENEQKVRDAVHSKMQEWETEKFDLESQVVELESQLESTKEVASATVNEDLILRLEAYEKENFELKVELHALSEKLRILVVESELSNQVAEAASKQHLESIKKVAKLEAECRKLRALTRKSQSCNENRCMNSVYVESLTDSQSDSGERMLSLDNDPSCSDSWASALVAELEQFKSAKCTGKNTSPSVEIDLMDDFLEMERLASIPVPEQTSHVIDNESSPEKTTLETCTLKEELDKMVQRITELEEKLGKMEIEKADTLSLLYETHEKLENSTKQMKDGEVKSLELQRQLDSYRASKQVSEIAIEAAEAKRKVLEAQLSAAEIKVHDLHDKVCNLERELDKERTSAEKLAIKCHDLEIEFDRLQRRTDILRARNSLRELKVKQERHLASAAGKLTECQQTIASIGSQLKLLAHIDESMLDSGDVEMQNGGFPIYICEDESVLKGSVEATHLVGSLKGKGKLSPLPPLLPQSSSSSSVDSLRRPSQVSSSVNIHRTGIKEKRKVGSS